MSSGLVPTPAPLELTADMLKEALPRGHKKGVTKEVMANITAALADPDLYEEYRENLLSYTAILQGGNFRLLSYVNAIKFVSLKARNFSNPAAYAKVFPDRLARFAQRRLTEVAINNNVQSYAKSTLVAKVLAQSLIPSWILNQDLFQQALNTQSVLMREAKSEKVRCDAANSILTHLKRPEVAKIELDIAVKEDSSIAILRQATLEHAAAQKMEVMGGGTSLIDIANSPLVLTQDKEEDE